jgi:adenylate kinase
MRLLICGAPGSGKGTQAPRIAAQLGIPAISTGDIFRGVAASGTKLGDELAAIMKAGQLIPDETTNKLLEERLAASDAAEGWLLDGYPRQIHQVHTLEDIMARSGTSLDAVIYLRVPDEELIERLLSRGAIVGRADDNITSITKRMEVFHEQTQPMLDFYAAQGTLREVDGHGLISEVEARIDEVLAKLGPVGVA